MTQEFVTLPREVAEQALEAMTAAMGVGPYKHRCSDAAEALHAALEQPQRKLTTQDIADSALPGNIESKFNACMHQEHCKRWKAQAYQHHQHKPNNDNELQRKTGDLITTAAPPQSGGIPPNWQLVPVEPTDAMLGAGLQHVDGMASMPSAYRAMLAAAPQPQGEQEICCKIWSVNRIDDLGKIVDSSGRLIATVYGLQAEKIVACHNSHAKQKPQNEQEPVAWIENVEGGIGYNPYHEAARKLPDGVRFDLYTHPQNLRCKSNQKRLATLWGYVKEQPKREPLTDEQVPSPTAGMNIAQRILHVGGRNNAAGYVEFGGIQAVEALVLQVLRDLPRQHEPQVEQEPVAWIRTEWSSRNVTFDGPPAVPSVRDELTKPAWTPLYTRPQPKREPLSTERIDELIEEGIFGGNPYELVRRLEEERGVFMTRPLTDEVIKDIHGAIKWHEFGSGLAFAHAIEAAHNIK